VPDAMLCFKVVPYQKENGSYNIGRDEVLPLSIKVDSMLKRTKQGDTNGKKIQKKISKLHPFD